MPNDDKFDGVITNTTTTRTGTGTGNSAIHTPTQHAAGAHVWQSSYRSIVAQVALNQVPARQNSRHTQPTNQPTEPTDSLHQKSYQPTTMNQSVTSLKSINPK